MKQSVRPHQWAIQGIMVWLILFVLFPYLLVIIGSLLTSDTVRLVTPPCTLMNYRFFCDPLYLNVIGHSLFMATIATLCCLGIGYPFAFIIARAPRKAQQWLLLLVIVPFWTNSLIRIYGLKLMIGAQGAFNTLLLTLGVIRSSYRIMYTEWAVIAGLVYLLLPFMIFPLYSSISRLDNRYLEAARDLGANQWYRFMRIILPLTASGIINGSLLVFLPAMGLFYVSDLLGGAKNLTVGNLIKTQFLDARNWPLGAAMSVGLILLMSLILLPYAPFARLLGRRSTTDG